MLVSVLLAAALAAPSLEARAEPPPPPPAPPEQSIGRARANYEAILRGEKSLGQLSPLEQDEIRQLDRRVRATQPIDTRSAYERCQDTEYAGLGREPTALDQRVIDTRCR